MYYTIKKYLFMLIIFLFFYHVIICSLFFFFGGRKSLLFVLKTLNYSYNLHKMLLQIEKYTASEYSAIFHCCPSLRILIHVFKFKKLVYFYDIFRKQVRKKNSSQNYRIHSEKKGGFFVDWLCF